MIVTNGCIILIGLSLIIEGWLRQISIAQIEEEC